MKRFSITGKKVDILYNVSHTDEFIIQNIYTYAYVCMCICNVIYCIILPVYYITTETHALLSLSIHSGLVPAPAIDTKIHGCSNPTVYPSNAQFSMQGLRNPQKLQFAVAVSADSETCEQRASCSFGGKKNWHMSELVQFKPALSKGQLCATVRSNTHCHFWLKTSALDLNCLTFDLHPDFYQRHYLG